MSAVADNVLSGSKIASFKGIILHRYLTSFSDTRKPRLATHEFPKRDGAKNENMGRAPHRTQWQLTFTGPSWIKDFRALCQSIDEDPSGPLVHPVFGQYPATCEGFDHSQVDIAQALDTVSLSLSFVENQLDGELDGTAGQGVAAKQQNVTSVLGELADAIVGYGSAAAAGALAAVQLAATAYEEAAGDSSMNATTDSSVEPKLDAVAQTVILATAAVLADPAATSNATAYPVLALLEEVYAACLELDEAVLAARPPTVEFVVAGTMHVAALAAARYGAENAAGRINEILALNDIPDPGAIPAGTVLVLPLK